MAANSGQGLQSIRRCVGRWWRGRNRWEPEACRGGGTGLAGVGASCSRATATTFFSLEFCATVVWRKKEKFIYSEIDLQNVPQIADPVERICQHQTINIAPRYLALTFPISIKFMINAPG
jgi:hypothetical protein